MKASKLGGDGIKLTVSSSVCVEVEIDGDRTHLADQVVVATGPFQVPRLPPIARPLDGGVVQLHSTAYRRPDQVPAGPVLVLGGGNTGFQIARSSRAHTRCTSRSGRTRRRCRSGSPAATCSATSKRWA
jgi:lysine/ornithine N-monooxygenase